MDQELLKLKQIAKKSAITSNSQSNLQSNSQSNLQSNLQSNSQSIKAKLLLQTANRGLQSNNNNNNQPMTSQSQMPAGLPALKASILDSNKSKNISTVHTSNSRENIQQGTDKSPKLTPAAAHNFSQVRASNIQHNKSPINTESKIHFEKNKPGLAIQLNTDKRQRDPSLASESTTNEPKVVKKLDLPNKQTINTHNAGQKIKINEENKQPATSASNLNKNNISARSLGAALSHSGAAPTHVTAGYSHIVAGQTHAGAGPTHAGAGTTHTGAGPTHAGVGSAHAGAGPNHTGHIRPIPQFARISNSLKPMQPQKDPKVDSKITVQSNTVIIGLKGPGTKQVQPEIHLTKPQTIELQKKTQSGQTQERVPDTESANNNKSPQKHKLSPNQQVSSAILHALQPMEISIHSPKREYLGESGEIPGLNEMVLRSGTIIPHLSPAKSEGKLSSIKQKYNSGMEEEKMADFEENITNTESKFMIIEEEKTQIEGENKVDRELILDDGSKSSNLDGASKSSSLDGSRKSSKLDGGSKSSKQGSKSSKQCEDPKSLNETSKSPKLEGRRTNDELVISLNTSNDISNDGNVIEVEDSDSQSLEKAEELEKRLNEELESKKIEAINKQKAEELEKAIAEELERKVAEELERKKKEEIKRMEEEEYHRKEEERRKCEREEEERKRRLLEEEENRRKLELERKINSIKGATMELELLVKKVEQNMPADKLTLIDWMQDINKVRPLKDRLAIVLEFFSKEGY